MFNTAWTPKMATSGVESSHTGCEIHNYYINILTILHWAPCGLPTVSLHHTTIMLVTKSPRLLPPYLHTVSGGGEGLGTRLKLTTTISCKSDIHYYRTSNSHECMGVNGEVLQHSVYKKLYFLLQARENLLNTENPCQVMQVTCSASEHAMK